MTAFGKCKSGEQPMTVSYNPTGWTPAHGDSCGPTADGWGLVKQGPFIVLGDVDTEAHTMLIAQQSVEPFLVLGSVDDFEFEPDPDASDMGSGLWDATTLQPYGIGYDDSSGHIVFKHAGDYSVGACFSSAMPGQRQRPGPWRSICARTTSVCWPTWAIWISLLTYAIR